MIDDDANEAPYTNDRRSLDELEARPILGSHQGDVYATESPFLWPLTVAIHTLCLVCLVLVCLWFGHYDSGYSWTTSDPAVFSWHPTLMTAGLLVCFSQAAVAFRTLKFLERPARKLVHGCIHSLALICVIIGLRAVFRFHNEKLPTPIPNMYSLHSWLGISTSIVFFAQYLFGFVAFGYPKLSQESRAKAVKPHARAGMLILTCLVAATVCTGVLEKMTFGGDCNKNGESNSKCHVANSFGMVSIALILCVAGVLLLPKTL